MSIIKWHASSKGETIVEVLVCLSIVAFSLSATYTLARLSLNQVRDAEERSQSIALAQQQLERLKAFLDEYPTLHTHPVVETDQNELDYILNPGPSYGIDCGTTGCGPGYNISAFRELSSPAPFPGFCIYKDLKTIYYTFDSQDPRCAVNQNGDFYCESHTCNASFPRDPIQPGGAADAAAVDAAGYPFRAGAGTLPLALQGYCPASSPPNPPHCSEDDAFVALAGRYEVGGIGQNADKYSLVSIPFRIHQ